MSDKLNPVPADVVAKVMAIVTTATSAFTACALTKISKEFATVLHFADGVYKIHICHLQPLIRADINRLAWMDAFSLLEEADTMDEPWMVGADAL